MDVGPLRLVVWDLGGQAPLRAIWPQYYRDAHALVFVVDSGCDAGRLSEAAAELAHAVAHPALRGAPVLVLANKQDAPSARPAAQVAAAVAPPGLAAQCAALCVQPCVATTGQGVTEGLQWLVDAIQIHPRRDPST